ncbi:MAG: hypothetical protein COA71_05535 [SAR86 cluster bacterium]|uniref:Uncharacterized protein n=1 Tax=SAR86 cluster bacterium TaxID=2030880 RepID=A0A2A5CEY0_9GAMM|nr:MAG: hypothetical protein COA71_05535 [SAR86 cluster bacterium]
MSQDEVSPQAAAPIELTGNWTTVITEDWRWRMATPPKGDYTSLPLNEEGIRVADMWEPEGDDANCKAYGAGNIMRMPIRVNISWEDDATLLLETDHGMQTRRFHFNPQDIMAGEPTLQGDSVAEWEGATLKVVTRNLKPGYIRKNGVPYSENAVVTEYFDSHLTYGEQWFTVSVVVEDPQYLSEPYYTSSSFKLLPDNNEWNPVNCEDR